MTVSPRVRRRTLFALAVVVLLPAWYVATWIVVSRAAHKGTISRTTAATIRPAFVPILSYCDSSLPASDALVSLWWDVNEPGHRSWSLDVSMEVEPLSPGRMPPRG